MSNFEVIDRRRDKKEDAPVVTSLPVAKGEWENVSYVIAISPQKDGSMILLGRAVGLRADGQTFLADYILPNIWPRDLDWPKIAGERLNTYLDCSCSRGGPCGVHKMYMAQWMEADMQRISLANSQPLPKAVEALVMAEHAAQAKKPNLIVPR